MKVETEFPGLCPEKTRHGKPRWRVRVEGNPDRKITIPCGPGDQDFLLYNAAARLGEQLDTAGPQKPGKGTFGALCDDFIRLMETQVAAKNLSELTLSSRRTGLTQAQNVKTPKGRSMRDVSANLPKEAFTKIIDSFGTRTGAAQTCLKALRAVYTWGEERGYVRNSEVFGVKVLHREKGGAVPWMADDIALFLNAHGPGTMARLWFCLAHATGNRIGDARIIGPNNVKMIDGVRLIEWQPQKRNSKFVSVPMHQMLAAELELHDLTGRETYLVTDYGRPFASTKSLGNRVAKWCIEAGLCEPRVDAAGQLVRDKTGKPEMSRTRSLN
jgi:hypothetical protein